MAKHDWWMIENFGPGGRRPLNTDNVPWWMRPLPPRVFNGGGAATPVGPVLLLSDTFTDTNGTPLQSHTIAPTNTLALTWAMLINQASVQSNAVLPDGTTASHYPYCLDPLLSDVAIELKFLKNASSAVYQGILARVVDSTHYWIIGIASNNTFSIVEWSTTGTVRATAAVTIGASCTIKVIVKGTTIKATLDDANELTYTSSTYQTATKHGFKLRGSASGSADDFKLWSNPPDTWSEELNELLGVGNFVTRSGAALQDGASPFRIAGANYYGLNVGLTAEGYSGTPTLVASNYKMDDLFATAKAMGVNVIRSYIPIGYDLSLWPTLAGPLAEAAALRMDYAIYLAQQYGIRLIYNLINANSASSGSDASFSNWGGADFFTDATAIANFKIFLTAILNRVNTITGIRYRNEPAILGWTLCNERPYGYATWASEIAAYVKGIDTHHLIMDHAYVEVLNDPLDWPVADPNIDIYGRSNYPMSTATIDADLTAVGASKVYAVVEYTHGGSYAGENALITEAAYLSHIEGKSTMGDLFITLAPHEDVAGFSLGKRQTGSYRDMNYGDPGDYDSFILHRSHAHIMQGLSLPDYPAALAPVLHSMESPVITWQGAAGALTYTIEQSADGLTNWSELATGLTDWDCPYVDTTYSSGSPYYRVKAINGDGIGTYSNIVQMPASAPIVLFDDFSTTGALDGSTPIIDAGFNWVTYLGGWANRLNVCQQNTTGNAWYSAAVDSGVADGTVTVKIKTLCQSYFDCGIVLRAVDDANFLYAVIQKADIGGSNITIRKCEAGVHSTLVSTTHAYLLDTAYELKVVMSGNTLTASCDGATAEATSTFNNTATKHGIIEYRDASKTFGINLFRCFTVK